jgi:hypothetical protein
MNEELMKEDLRQAIIKEHPVAMMKEQKRKLTGRQPAALALQKVTTVTCRVSDTRVCPSFI